MAPLASGLGLSGGTTAGLLLFGVGAIIGVVGAGYFVDGYLRQLVLVMIVLAALSMALLAVFGQHFAVGHVGVFLWGLSFGGMPTIIQAAASRIAQSESELATAMIATIYNVGIFGGSWIGGLALASAGLSGLFWIVVAAMVASLIIVLAGKRVAFPSTLSAVR
jgi:predicted MFS family arabinose efflux permease